MKTQFIVTIDGTWFHGDKRATPAMIEKELRKVVKDGFEFIVDRTTVKRIPTEKAAIAKEKANQKGGA